MKLYLRVYLTVLNCNELSDFKLSFPSDSLVESLWLEVSNNNIKYVLLLGTFTLT